DIILLIWVFSADGAIWGLGERRIRATLLDRKLGMAPLALPCSAAEPSRLADRDLPADLRNGRAMSGRGRCVAAGPLTLADRVKNPPAAVQGGL
ncbi:MAG: hypothetical protein L0G27_09480, partial [Paracoccus sp. (in: a-proteobacteria)]|nr:hypothetical protein [Paracoccus sp. (in: a-proteobacteria)]